MIYKIITIKIIFIDFNNDILSPFDIEIKYFFMIYLKKY
jgi:hypothetical protein